MNTVVITFYKMGIVMLVKNIFPLVAVALLSGNSVADQAEQQAEIYNTLSEEFLEKTLSELQGISPQAPSEDSKNHPKPEKYLGVGVGQGAAPGLYHLQTIEVDSAKKSHEPIDDYQLATRSDHGGKRLRAWTAELGYGGYPYATMNGRKMQQSQEIQLCKNYSGRIVLCTKAGFMLIGYLREWKLDGYQSGVFQYESTSISYPWGIYNDRLTIR